MNKELEETSIWSIYWLIIGAALALVAGRVVVVSSIEGDTAFLSANDRSRWCTIASLVEDGTYEIDRQVAIFNPIHRHRRPWNTIDKVQHIGRDGDWHQYSSKPPLYPTMIAGIYACLNGLTGLRMTDHPVYVPRIILAIVNIPMLAILFIATTSVTDRMTRSIWAKLLSVLGMCFGTMLGPFSISLSNHVPAAAAIAVAAWLYFRAIDRVARQDLVQGAGEALQEGLIGLRIEYLSAGIAIALAAANELPALSIMVCFVALFALVDRRSVAPVISGVCIVGFAFFGTNWVAHQSFRPPYAHRGDGALLETISEVPQKWLSEFNDSAQPSDQLTDWLAGNLTGSNVSDLDSASWLASNEPNRLRLKTHSGDYALLAKDDSIEIRIWDDWYEYQGSYWQDGNRRGVDLGEPSRARYLFNMLVGHHGVFSLTPIWLLFPFGLVRSIQRNTWPEKRFALTVLLCTTICAAFYLMRPTIDRNYGGVSVCFRWLLWFAPLWMIFASKAVENFQSIKLAKWVTVCLLATSIFSASTAISNPWQSPWLYRYLEFLGWLGG